MRLWTPDPGTPELLEWWVPLVRAARRALDDRVPWLIVPDEWELAGRVERRARPDVWIYVHQRSRRELLVDGTGQPYRFIPNSKGPSPGRLERIEIRSAVWRAGLPDVSEGIFFDSRPRSVNHPTVAPEPPPRHDEREQPAGRPALYVVR